MILLQYASVPTERKSLVSSVHWKGKEKCQQNRVVFKLELHFSGYKALGHPIIKLDIECLCTKL